MVSTISILPFFIRTYVNPGFKERSIIDWPLFPEAENLKSKKYFMVAPFSFMSFGEPIDD